MVKELTFSDYTEPSGLRSTGLELLTDKHYILLIQSLGNYSIITGDEMVAKIDNLRMKLDQMSERIVSGLKDRSRYTISNGVFLEEFFNGMTWFRYRLFREQSLDSEFGRFEFEDQHPFIFKKDQLTPPKRPRPHADIGITSVEFDNGPEILNIYRDIIGKICKPGEDPDNYGEIAKLDVSNVLTLYERICGFAAKVAEFKIEKEPRTLHFEPEFLRSYLTDAEREKQVMDYALALARKEQLPNPEVMPGFFRTIIDRTLDLEVDYIFKASENRRNTTPRSPVGFGQTPRDPEPKRSGWGTK
jgi:chorismate mutase